MFQSIKAERTLYNTTTKRHEWEYALVDSDFSCVVFVNAYGVQALVGAAVIQEYSTRNLNVGVHLIRCFQLNQKRITRAIAEQMAWLEGHSLFTPEIKADLQKYLSLL